MNMDSVSRSVPLATITLISEIFRINVDGTGLQKVTSGVLRRSFIFHSDFLSRSMIVACCERYGFEMLLD